MRRLNKLALQMVIDAAKELDAIGDSADVVDMNPPLDAAIYNMEMFLEKLGDKEVNV